GPDHIVLLGSCSQFRSAPFCHGAGQRRTGGSLSLLSWYMCAARPICLRLLAHQMRAAAWRGFWTAGGRRAISTAEIGRTTSSSISVKARRVRIPGLAWFGPERHPPSSRCHCTTRGRGSPRRHGGTEKSRREGRLSSPAFPPCLRVSVVNLFLLTRRPGASGGWLAGRRRRGGGPRSPRRRARRRRRRRGPARAARRGAGPRGGRGRRRGGGRRRR